MYLLRFLNLVVVLLSMQGQKALGFHQSIFICVPKKNEYLMGLEQLEGNYLQNFHFWMNFKWTVWFF